MNEEKELIDQSELAKSVSDQIKYQFLDYFLVKPLDPIKVKKEVSVPVTDEDPKKDKNGVEAKDFDDVKTEVVEVDSDYRKAVVIKLPVYYENNKDYPNDIAINYLGRKITYKDLLESIDKTAAAFIKAGVKEKEIVTVALPSIPEALYCVYALNKIGAVANMIHPLLLGSGEFNHSEPI